VLGVFAAQLAGGSDLAMRPRARRAGAAAATGVLYCGLPVLALIWVRSLTLGLIATLFLLVCVVAFLIIGLALDAGPALLLLAPFLLPISRQMGIDDIHFSMVMIVSCTLGLISPPVGVCLFVACKIGNITQRQLWKELWPFFTAECVVVLLMVFFPVLSTGLVSLLFN
jgi:TRAP-type C4-dicarboxylate transport system permease large subunit